MIHNPISTLSPASAHLSITPVSDTQAGTAVSTPNHDVNSAQDLTHLSRTASVSIVC